MSTTLFGRPFDLSAPLRGVSGAKNLVGDLAEALAGQLLGAEPWYPHPGFDIPEEVVEGEHGYGYTLEPDLFWKQDTALIEVKAGISRFYVTKKQFASYKWLRDGGLPGRHPIHRPRVYYAFMSYRTPRRSTDYLSVGDYLNAVLHTTRYMLFLDSNLVQWMADRSGSRDFANEPESPDGIVYHPYHRITAASLEPFALFPQEALERHGFHRWRARSLHSRQVPLFEHTPFGRLPEFKAFLIRPCRNKRTFSGPMIGEQYDFLVHGRRPNDDIPF